MYFKAFPGVRKYIDNAHKMALWNKFVITPLGQRKRQYGAYDCFKPTAAYNASLRNGQNVIIQSTTSSVGLITFAELNRRWKEIGVDSTCSVYDSLEARCPIDRMAEAVNIAYDVLDNWPLEMFDWLELPIGCEGEIGISWGELSHVKHGVTQEECLAVIESIKKKSLTYFGF